MVHITFAINLCVAGISYFVYDFKIEPVILCVVYCYLTTRVSDHILKGGKEALKVEMITAHPDEITQHVIRDLRHSATIIHAEGGYSHQGKTSSTSIRLPSLPRSSASIPIPSPAFPA